MVNQIKRSGALNIVKFIKKGNSGKVNDTIDNSENGGSYTHGNTVILISK